MLNSNNWRKNVFFMYNYVDVGNNSVPHNHSHTNLETDAENNSG